MHRFRLFAVLALALVLSAAVSTARATASTTQQITWTQSQTMVAVWQYQSDCDMTQVVVDGVIGRVRINGTRSVSAFASVSISRYDTCTNTFVILVSSCCASLSGTMQINAGLTSARMTGTFPDLIDFNTGATYTVSVDVAWTASGTASRTESEFTTQSPGLVVHSQTQSVEQPAIASGTVSDGTTNYTPQPASFAAMDSSKNGSLNITIG
jgi:hypothetical protein